MLSRKVIHTSVALSGFHEMIVATCDDGTVWSIPARHKEPTPAYPNEPQMIWTQLPPIPQPEQQSLHHQTTPKS